MVAFVKELAGSYKKTQYLKEALTHSWAAGNLDYSCKVEEGNRSKMTGNTILHVAAILGETKLVRFFFEVLNFCSTTYKECVRN